MLQKRNKQHLFRGPSEVVQELENHWWAATKQVNHLKKMKSLNNVPDDFKKELETLFSVMSYQYEWFENGKK